MVQPAQSRFQLMPELTYEEYQALKADIAQRGILVPIEVDETGQILDGHHRLKAWQELRAEGIKVPDYSRQVRAGMSQVEKEAHVLAINLYRRHLSREQRQQTIAKLRAKGWTLEKIATVAGVHPDTVSEDLKSTFGNPKVDLPTHTKIKGKDGKYRPAQYKPRKPKPPKTIFAKTEGEQAKAVAAVAEAGPEALPDKTIDTRRASRLAREHQAKEKAKEVSGEVTQSDVSLLIGDFRERGKEIADASVDLIFTDPPYDEASLPLWQDLSMFAARVLQPEGMLVTYTGAMYLPQVLSLLGQHLKYWWVGTIILGGPHSRVHARHIAQGSKPLLFFVPRDFHPTEERWIEDTYTSEGEEKEAHQWQQSLGAAVYYISKLCRSGGLVVDPFLGGGTTAVAAKRLGRRCIGIEIDKVAFASAQSRLTDHG